MLGALQLIEDKNGTLYLALVLDIKEHFFQLAWSALLQQGLQSSIEQRNARDGSDRMHITVCNAQEYAGIKKHNAVGFLLIDGLLGKHFTIEFHGIGKAVSSKNEEHEAWFGVASVPKMSQLRTELGMKPKDFHATLAFSPKDVFDAPKGMNSIVFTLDFIEKHSLPSSNCPSY